MNCALCGMGANGCALLVGTPRGLVCSGCVGVLVEMAFASVEGEGPLADVAAGVFAPGQAALPTSGAWGRA